MKVSSTQSAPLGDIGVLTIYIQIITTRQSHFQTEGSLPGYKILSFTIGNVIVLIKRPIPSTRNGKALTYFTNHMTYFTLHMTHIDRKFRSFDPKSIFLTLGDRETLSRFIISNFTTQNEGKFCTSMHRKMT